MKKDVSILVLDDEQNVLNALSRTIGKKYNMYSTTDPSEALDLLGAHNDIKVIISDQRMEKMTGVEFLSESKKINPDTKRIILSGYCDFSTIGGSIDDGTVHKFVQKPWDDASLLETIEELLDDQNRHFNLSNVDFLTGLGNKRGLVEEINSGERKGSLLFLIDIHRFRNLNAAYGQIVADVVLEKIGNLLNGWAFNHYNSYIARTFADEFAIVIDGNSVGMTHKEIAAQLQDLLSRHFIVNSTDFKLSVYIGSTIIDEKSANNVLKKAKFALLFAKKNGINSYQAYESDYMDVFIRQETFIDHDIWLALERGEFILDFQPTFTKTGEVFYIQSLLRWNHPEFGLVPPFRFMSIIENSSYMIEVGTWVIKNAIRLQTEISKAVGRNLKMLIKISPKQFEDPHFRDKFVDAIEECSAIPSNILCELTETSISNKSEECAYHMRQLNALGVGAAINGLGTGHSTLSLFQKTQFQYVKLNQLLVHNMEHSPEIKKSVLSLIHLSHSMGAKTVGCGIESEDQLNTLKSMGCELFEGFYLALPMDADTLIKQYKNEGAKWAVKS